MTTPVYILFADGHRTRGSVIMRGLQLAALGNDYLMPDYAFRTQALPKKRTGTQLPYVLGLRDGVVILQKAAAEHIDAEAFDYLKANNIAVAADWIDKDPKSPHLDRLDFHIASSWAQWADLRARFPEAAIRHITHHADPRLRGSVPSPTFATLYLGHAGNAKLPRDREITVVDIRTEQDFTDSLSLMGQFPFHYAVRDETPRPGIFKPFTKGFTAAACDANILVQRGAHDAVAYLGDDYPFLIDDASPRAIRAGLDLARETYGGPIWQGALDVMAQVHDRSRPKAVAHEMAGILAEVVGTRGVMHLPRL
ncbi:MAG: hypothetical protein AAGL89_18580, partial [Pseudomonadota bacterium]